MVVSSTSMNNYNTRRKHSKENRIEKTNKNVSRLSFVTQINF